MYKCGVSFACSMHCNWQNSPNRYKNIIQSNVIMLNIFQSSFFFVKSFLFLFHSLFLCHIKCPLQAYSVILIPAKTGKTLALENLSTQLSSADPRSSSKDFIYLAFKLLVLICSLCVFLFVNLHQIPSCHHSTVRIVP